MSNQKAFGSKELCHCLKELGFTFKDINASHRKYHAPKGHKIPNGERPFMIVQDNVKTFSKHSQKRYVSELYRKGFLKKDIYKLL